MISVKTLVYGKKVMERSKTQSDETCLRIPDGRGKVELRPVTAIIGHTEVPGH